MESLKYRLKYSDINYGDNIKGHKKNRVILFCQAPADVRYILDIYEQNFSENNVTVNICVINVKPLYQFFQSLKLDAYLFFIPYHPINLKNLVKVYAERRRINTLWNKYFDDFQSGKVYFFSRFEDWLTPAFIYRFSKRASFEIFYVSHYDNSSLLFEEKNFSFRSLVFIVLLKYLTGARFQDKIAEKRPEFLWSKYDIKELKLEIRENNLSKYNYNVELPEEDTKKDNVLFFVAPCNKALFSESTYLETCVKIVSKLQECGFNVYIKGHPRMGAPEAVRNAAGLEIPSYIPGEFIDSKNFKYCFGIDTVAICYFARNGKLPTFSLMNMFPTRSTINKENAIRYLQQQSENKIQFVNSIKEFTDSGCHKKM